VSAQTVFGCVALAQSFSFNRFAEGCQRSVTVSRQRQGGLVTPSNRKLISSAELVMLKAFHD
jgi:hypothetical protein